MRDLGADPRPVVFFEAMDPSSPNPLPVPPIAQYPAPSAGGGGGFGSGPGSGPPGGGGGRRPGSGKWYDNPLAVLLLVSLLLAVTFGALALSMRFVSRMAGSSGSGTVVKAAKFLGKGSVGVIELNGVILDSKGFLKRLEWFKEQSQVRALVVRINSPGGAVAPSQEIYEAVKAFPRPVVASMGSVAASGGYYVAMGAKTVYANPGTITGSIGVIMEFMNLEKLYEWAKVKRYAIKTGKFKSVGAEYREMTAEERELLQGMVDNVLGQFKRAVADGRKMQAAEVTAIADGRIFSGEQAKQRGLVDELGTLHDAVAAAGKLAGLSDDPETVYFERKRSLPELLFSPGDDEEVEGRAGGGPAAALGALARALLGVGPSAAALDVAGERLAPGIYWLWQPAG